MQHVSTKSKGQTTPQALERFRDQLLASGMDKQAAGYLIGRLMGQISKAVAVEALRLLGKEALLEVESLEDELQKAKEFSRRFAEKKGISLQAYRDQLACKFVEDFERAG